MGRAQSTTEQRFKSLFGGRRGLRPGQEESSSAPPAFVRPFGETKDVAQKRMLLLWEMFRGAAVVYTPEEILARPGMECDAGDLDALFEQGVLARAEEHLPNGQTRLTYSTRSLNKWPEGYERYWHRWHLAGCHHA